MAVEAGEAQGWVFGKHSGREMIGSNLFMCGRYRLSRRKQIIEEHFDTISGDEDWTPRYNVSVRGTTPLTCISVRKCPGLSLRRTD